MSKLNRLYLKAFLGLVVFLISAPASIYFHRMEGAGYFTLFLQVASAVFTLTSVVYTLSMIASFYFFKILEALSDSKH